MVTTAGKSNTFVFLSKANLIAKTNFDKSFL
jgi:hypothetical protein